MESTFVIYLSEEKCISQKYKATSPTWFIAEKLKILLFQFLNKLL